MNQEKENRFNLINDFRRFYELLQNGAQFCAFDTETTGLKSESDRIIEIGAVKFDKTGVLDSFGTLVHSEIPVSEAASKINHITNDMLINCPKPEQVMADFLRISKDCILIAHNAQFDIRFVNAELERQGKLPLRNKAIDTLRFTRWAYPENEHWTLQHLAQQLNINVENAHRAEDDARVCMEIFLQTVIATKDRKKGKRKPALKNPKLQPCEG